MIYRFCMYCWTGMSAAWAAAGLSLGEGVMLFMALLCASVAWFFGWAARG